MSEGLKFVPLASDTLTRKDYASGQEVRWCPGCGDYSILSALQSVLPDLRIAKENTAIISGIGCSSRLPYYMNTYGMHSIHGRAPTIATGLAMSRPDLAVLVITGDGDALSIGGNHLIHALRRNVNITIIVFNNRIYGLTKGQFSPTSEPGKVTKSSPYGSADTPLNAVSLALGAEASFVARTVDADRTHMAQMMREAISHRGAALLEVYQNCPIFNDGAWDELTAPDADGLIKLEAGEPIVNTSSTRGITLTPDGSLAWVPVNEQTQSSILIHDPHIDDPSRAFALSRLADSGVMKQAPIGIFRQVNRPAFDDLSRDAIVAATGGEQAPTADQIRDLLHGSDTWQIT